MPNEVIKPEQVAAALVSLVVVPIIPAAIAVGVSVWSLDLGLSAFFGLLPLGLFFSYAAAVFLGVPAFFLLVYFFRVTWWSSLTVGVALGAVVAVFLSLPKLVQMEALVLDAALGAISAFSFWLIWRSAG